MKKNNSNQIYIWQANLIHPDEEIALLHSTLSHEEQSKANRFVNSKLRDKYVISHGVLRNILAQYLKVEPSAITFGTGAQGKPYLLGKYPGGALSFNMSHSENMAVYAIGSPDVELGIDVEYIKENIEAEEIAKRFFSSSEYTQLIGLPESNRLKGFYRCWTRKESFIKAIGKGLSFPLNQFAVSLESCASNFNCLSYLPEEHFSDQWSVQSLFEHENYIGALGVKGNIKELVFFSYEPKTQKREC